MSPSSSVAETTSPKSVPDPVFSSTLRVVIGPSSSNTGQLLVGVGGTGVDVGAGVDVGTGVGVGTGVDDVGAGVDDVGTGVGGTGVGVGVGQPLVDLYT